MPTCRSEMRFESSDPPAARAARTPGRRSIGYMEHTEDFMEQNDPRMSK
jgi:hypothetical protein